VSRRRKTRDYVGTHEVHRSCGFTLSGFALEERFRVRVYEAEDEIPIIVLSELESAGSYISIADDIRLIAAEIVLKEFPDEAIRAKRNEPFFHLVEHLPASYDHYPESGTPRDLFELIEFDDYRMRVGSGWRRRVKDVEKALEENTRAGNRRLTFGSYRGRKVTKEEVEQMIGMTLDDTLDAPLRALTSDLPDIRQNRC
jgi:hypothetical protein